MRTDGQDPVLTSGQEGQAKTGERGDRTVRLTPFPPTYVCTLQRFLQNRHHLLLKGHLVHALRPAAKAHIAAVSGGQSSRPHRALHVRGSVPDVFSAVTYYFSTQGRALALFSELDPARTLSFWALGAGAADPFKNACMAPNSELELRLHFTLSPSPTEGRPKCPPPKDRTIE